MEYNVCDAGSRLLFKFRSGVHGCLNEELGRHRGKNWVGIEGRKVRRDVLCVGMSVRM